MSRYMKLWTMGLEASFIAARSKYKSSRRFSMAKRKISS